MSGEMIALVLIGLEIAAGFTAAFWAFAMLGNALAKIDERSQRMQESTERMQESTERIQESTERLAQYLAVGPRR